MSAADPQTEAREATEAPALLEGDERTKAVAAHLGIVMGAPVVAALILLVGERGKPDRSPYYIRQLKQAVVFQAVVIGACLALLVAFCLALLAARNTLAWSLAAAAVTALLGSNVYALAAAARCRRRAPFGYIVIKWVVR